MHKEFINPLKYSDFQTSSSPIYISEAIIAISNPLRFHSHDFYEIFFVTSGVLNHHIGEDNHEIHPHSYQLILPEYIHGFSSSSSPSSRFMNLAFPKDLLNDDLIHLFDCLTRHTTPIHPTTTNTTDWTSFMAQIYQLSLCTDYNKIKIRFRHLLSAVLLHTLDHLQDIDDTRPKWLKKALVEMAHPINYKKGLQQFVKISARTQEHLTRELVKHYHMTPSQYLNGLKVEASAELLSTTDLSILEIQLECGYLNTSYFNTCFKEKYQMTPSAYRKKNRSIF